MVCGVSTSLDVSQAQSGPAEKPEEEAEDEEQENADEEGEEEEEGGEAEDEDEEEDGGQPDFGHADSSQYGYGQPDHMMHAQPDARDGARPHAGPREAYLLQEQPDDDDPSVYDGIDAGRDLLDEGVRPRGIRGRRRKQALSCPALCNLQWLGGGCMS